MLKLRKLVANVVIITILSILLNSVWINAEEAVRFSDIPSTAWYLNDLQYILGDSRKIFSGYPDGTFKPNDTLTVDMYIKLIVTVMGHKVENGGDYWASTYIQKALDEGYIVPAEDLLIVRRSSNDPYAGFKKPINREDMALITGRALNQVVKENEYRDPLSVSGLIKDYTSISNHAKANIVKCYDLGIITGFPDGDFKPDNILSRAEAVAVIRRLIDPPARKRAELPVVAKPSPTPIPADSMNRPDRKDLGNGVVEVEGIKFDPETDIVNKTNGAMGILKAEQFVGVALEYLRFYEHEGKARVRGYIPELPEGYEWEIAIHSSLKEINDKGYSWNLLTTEPSVAPENKLPEQGNSFDRPLFTTKGNIESLYLNFEIIAPSNASGGDFYISLTLQKYSRNDKAGGYTLVEKLDPRGFFEW